MTTIMIQPLLIQQFRKRISLTPQMQSCIKKIVKKVFGLVKRLGLPLRQSYTFVLKQIYRDQRFRNHPKTGKKPLGQTGVYVQ